ncbi:MAG: cell division protein ZapA [Alistipes sp.]|nr:cell division protein ZapA [Alistipes sp.]
MEKQAITLKIAGRSYPLNIDREKEEVYRLAEREVNAYLAQIKQNNIKNWEETDYLAIVALNFAISAVNMRRSREGGDEEMKRLAHLEEELARYLDNQRD